MNRIDPKPAQAHSHGRARGLRLALLPGTCNPSGLRWDKSFLLRGFSAATGHEQWPLALPQPPEPPVLCQPNRKGHYYSNCPREQCEALCGSTVAHCPADSGLLRWGSRLLSRPDSQPQHLPCSLPFIECTSGSHFNTCQLMGWKVLMMLWALEGK